MSPTAPRDRLCRGVHIHKKSTCRFIPYGFTFMLVTCDTVHLDLHIPRLGHHKNYSIVSTCIVLTHILRLIQIVSRKINSKTYSSNALIDFL